MQNFADNLFELNNDEIYLLYILKGNMPGGIL